MASFRLREAEKSALLGELQLIFTKIRPMSEFGGFVFGRIRIAVGWADALQLHKDIQEDMEILLRLEGKRTLPLLRHVEKCASDRANFHGLGLMLVILRVKVEHAKTYKAISIGLHVNLLNAAEYHQKVFDNRLALFPELMLGHVVAASRRLW